MNATARTHYLLRRIALGEETALAELIESSHHDLICHIKRRCPELDEYAEGIFNQAMLKVWTKAPQYKGSTTQDPQKQEKVARAWLYKIVTNLTIDAGRWNSLLRDHEIDESDLEKQAESDESAAVDRSPLDLLQAGDCSPEEQVAQKSSVEAFMATLSEEEQNIIYMLDQGYSQKEIATTMGVSEARISQIRSQLRKNASNLL